MTTLLSLPLNVALPGYTTLMGYVPEIVNDVLNVPTPLLNGAVPICNVPLKMLTAPDNGPAVDVTLNVKPTDWVAIDGFVPLLRVMAVFALLTTCVVDELLSLKLAVPI
jgi:hypothetical protein